MKGESLKTRSQLIKERADYETVLGNEQVF